MASGINRLRRDRSGIVSLEFALIAPGFLLMFFGTIEMGRYLFTRQSLELLTGQVARAAVIGTITPGCPLTLPASFSIPPMLAPGNLSVCVSQSTPAGSETQYQVTSTYDFTFFLPVFAASSGMISAKVAPTF